MKKSFWKVKIMHPKFYTVVVIYNKAVSQSPTCGNLKKIIGHNITVIIADNSTKDMGNSSLCKNEGWIYIPMGGNIGLSRAYNKVLDFLREYDGIVIWFDDDTNVTQAYFDTLALAVAQKPEIDIFAPVIMGQNGKIYSPNEARFFKNKQLKSPYGKLQTKKFNAINSCTAIRLPVFKDYRYDQRIFLDQVDHSFFEDQRKLQRAFYKLDVIIKHNFSLKSKQSTPQICWKRYEIMIPDYLVFCSKSKARLFLGLIKVGGWGIRESIRYKYPKFIFWCLRKAMYCLMNPTK